MSVAPARAQQYENVGIRAQGMAGAFVAVADDATATWWNPAGLATGPYFDGLVEYTVIQQPRELEDSQGQLQPGWESRVRGIALAYPALGLSYYRLQISEIQPIPPTAEEVLNRQEQRAGGVGLRTLVLHQFGATVGQSLGNHLVIGSTLKLVRGSIASGLGTPAEAAFDRARALEGDAETHADLDMGALASLGNVRLGLTVKNIRRPEFGPDDSPFKLKRQARAGLAVVGRSLKVIDQLTVAVDTDLTEAATAVGTARYVAGGVEAWTLSRRLGLRAGVSANTIGERLTSPSGGVSLGLLSGLYLEGQYTAGSDKARRGWGFDVRVTF